MNVRLLQTLTAAAGTTALTIGALALSPLLMASAATSTITLAAPAPITIGDSNFTAGFGFTPVPGIGQATSYPMTATVVGRPGAITHVQVMLDLVDSDHADDLDIVLVAPDGRKVVLMSDVGGGAINKAVNFDGDAANFVPDDAPPVALWNRPSEAEPGDSMPVVGAVSGVTLGDLEGMSPNGTWKLYVYDDSTAGPGPGEVDWQLYLFTDGGTVPSPSTIQVGGLAGVVTDVDVILHGLHHQSLSNLDVMLRSPNGKRAMLISDVGSNEVDPVDLTLDDEAPGHLGDMPVTGSYRPTDVDDQGWPWAVDRFPGQPDDVGDLPSYLGVLDGIDPNGEWSLYVVDDGTEDWVGAMDGGWSLRLTTQPAAVPVPPADGVPPRVTARQPGAKVDSVRRGASIRATFSEPMRASSLTRASVWLKAKGSKRKVRARVRYDADTRMVTLDPQRRLREHTTYRFVVTTQASDLAGNRLDQRAATIGRQRYATTFRTS